MPLVEAIHGVVFHVIGIEDLILNRLEEFVFWDRQDIRLPAAIQLRLMLTAYGEQLDVDYLRTEAEKRGVRDGLDHLQTVMQTENA